MRENILGLKGTEGREELAKRIERSYKTIERWESKKADNFPNSDSLAKILNRFPDKTINLNWLLSGYGEPFPGARQQFPEACGPDTLLYKEKEREEGGEVKEGNALYQAGVDHSTDLLKNILSSGDPVMIQAILSNLRAFNQAIQSKKKDQDRIGELETRVAALEEKLSDQDEMETEEEKLKKGGAA